MKFKCAYGIVPGLSSIGQGTDRQSQIRFVNKNGVAAVCLADTEGTLERAKFYAELAAEAGTALMTERFDEMYSLEDDSVKKEVLEKIEEVFRKAGLKLSGVKITLLFAAVKAGRYLAGNMGDGLVARLDGGSSVLLVPEDGPFPGRTYFAAQDNELGNLRICRGDLEGSSGLMIMSAGGCRSLYESGTGSLSPACGTFFEWLKEYDEETVSEALADNIDKYFIKDTKGDIGIAVLAPDDDDAETAAEGSDTEESEAVSNMEEALEENAAHTLKEDKIAEIGNGRKKLKYAIAAAILVLAVILIFALRQPGSTVQKPGEKGDKKPPVTQSQDSGPSGSQSKGSESPAGQLDNMEPTVSFSAENPVSYDPGQYEVGQDISAGEYFFWTGEMLEPGSIEINGESCLSDKLYCMTVQVGEGDTLYSDYRFTAASNVNPVKAAKGILISGKYKIGKDIAPGNYTISPESKDIKGRYYSVLDGKIDNADTFSDDTAVVVPKEGYIVFYHSVLHVEGNK